MVRRPCLDCGRIGEGSRCTVHQRAKDTVVLAGKRARRPRLAGEDARRARAVAQHRRVAGNWCPGWGRDPHLSDDLTADHPLAVGAGGSERQALTVLCRQCNGRKGAH